MSLKTLAIAFCLSLLVTASVCGGPIRKDKGASSNGYYDSSLSNCQQGTAPFQNGENSCVAFAKELIYAGTYLGGANFAYQNNPVDHSSGNFEVFKIPVLLEAGTQIQLTFTTLNNYGVFYCENGSATYAVDYTDGGDPTPLTGLMCTQGNIPQNPNAFFTEVDSGNTATITFNSAAASLLDWTFYTTPGNLTGYSLIYEPLQTLLLAPSDSTLVASLEKHCRIWRRKETDELL
jgi:hypothetical protein